MLLLDPYNGRVREVKRLVYLPILIHKRLRTGHGLAILGYNYY